MAVLVVEISATRMLAPFFGNSIFTFSSVIGIVLAALSLGYYVGGRLADRKPSEAWFFSLIVVSGFSVLVLQVLNAVVLPAIAYKLSMVNGPLLVSLLMFFVPALFLAMLSPYAITLLHARATRGGVGNASGLVFFWSTLGSIAGSLGTGFLLIPHWGIGRIIVGVGVGLVLLGGVGLLMTRRMPGVVPVGVMLLGLISGMALRQIAAEERADIVYAADGLYERIVIRDMRHQGRPVRILWQDRNMSSGLLLDDGSMAFEYTKYFELYRLFTPRLQSALAIGGGAYSVPRSILQDAPQAIVDVAEIEPSLHSLAIRYFELPDDARLRNHVMDGRRFLHDTAERYDLIFSDAYSSFISMQVQFTTREFFQLAKSRLNENGVLIANYYGSLSAETRSMLYSVLRTMRAVFPQVYVIATENPASEKLQNFIFVAHNASPPGRRTDLRQAADIEFTHPVLKGVAALELRPPQSLLESYPLLTDDFAPVEHYAASAIRRYAATAKRVR
ncbi:MAG: fused MFS/spermidine synthase [Betaproteobacteria bacterium]|nr:fused MFS/spermidine synthase [Betaproteobacteria bacterium]MDH5219602.1 fused MFS/spermidine synthase [Betaproteobacteria bacterium]MDH5349990.1 fused MFS/spermidine synthase [Betaproteobacteria bacterium]